MEENTNLEQNDNLNKDTVLDNSVVEFEIADPQQINKKSKLPFVLGAAAVVLVAVAAIAFFCMSGPESVVKKTISKNVQDFTERDGIFNRLVDDEILSAYNQGEFNSTGTIQLENNSITEKVNGVAISFDNVLSAANKKFSGDYSLQYNGFELIDLQSYIDENNTTFYIPALFEQSLSIGNENIVAQAKQSPLFGSYIQKRMQGNEDFSVRIFDYAQTNANVSKFQEKTNSLLKTAFSDLGNGISYEKADKTITYNEEECEVYNITLPADGVKQSVSTFLTELKNSEEYKAALDTYFENAGNIAAEDVEQAKNQINADIDNAVTSIQSADMSDVTVELSPLKDGVLFDINQQINEYNIALVGEYNQTNKTLTINADINNGNSAVGIVYTDRAMLENGVVTTYKDIEFTIDGEGVQVTNSNTYNPEDNSVVSSLHIVDSESDMNVMLNLDGVATKADGKVDLIINRLDFSNGEQNASLSGNYSFGKLTEQPQPIDVAENVEVFKMDQTKAFELYQQLQDKLGQLKELKDMF